MKRTKKRNKILAGFLAFVLALILGAGIPAIPAYAASGAVYTCTITPCYRHPVTGVIEDSGGEASYATGQGMVEGCIYTTGIIEVTSDGNYYLTIRMSLMDYTSNHSFWVQNVGDSGWSSPAVGVTGNGTDSNGTTADICMQVPSENCVVRGSMYVEPMGRDVVFYLYPSNYSEGNSTNMNSTMITSDNSTSTAGSGSSSSGTGSTSTDGSASASGSGSSSTVKSSGGSLSGGSSLSAGTSSLSSGSDSEDEESDSEDGDEETMPLQSTITEAATSDTTQNPQDTELDSAQGLSLSTADGDTEEEKASVSGTSVGQQILVRIVSMTVTGLILLAAGAAVVYFFRRNWYRWGGGEDDNDDDEE